MSDARVPVADLLDAFGVPVTVSRPYPDDLAIETTGAWSATPRQDESPVGGDIHRRQPRRIMTLAVADVPSIVRGTKILAPLELGGTILTWAMDEFDGDQEWDSWRVVLTRVKD